MTTVAARADLIVVGAGLAGAAAARSAAARGASVVVLEQFAPGHRNGSSHGSARIFRRAYPDPLYVRLTGQAGEEWRALEAAAGETLLTMTGEIDFGAVREPAGLHAVLTGCGVPADLLPAGRGEPPLAAVRLHRRRASPFSSERGRARPGPGRCRAAAAGDGERRRRPVQHQGHRPRGGR